MTEGSIYSKRWRLWDATMLYARGVMYVVFTILVITDYISVNRLASEGVSLEHAYLTPPSLAIQYATAANILVVLVSIGSLFPAITALHRKRLNLAVNLPVIALILALCVHIPVLNLTGHWRTVGLTYCMTGILFLICAENLRHLALNSLARQASTEALTRDQERPGEPPQEPSPD